jgi:anthranilate/para-aminobenzoate synthase component I
MKGSWPSGRLIDDLFGGIRLKFDAKNRAENVMIADLLRNDLGRVATGIRAPRLFEVARYRTIFQMTSTVTGRVPVRIGMQELFRAIFPSGSVTGAPKIRAMQVIRALERSPRRIYTGAIGWITPRREMFFNVPIRTLLIRGRDGEMGVGGGIVWDSTAPGEWAEGQWKSRFLAQAATQRIA